MKASSLKLGLSLAAAGVFSPLSVFAQAAAPAAPAAAPAAPAAAPAAPAAAAPAATPVTAPEPAPTPATEPAPLAPKDTATTPAAAPETAAAAAPAEPAPAAEPPPPAATVTGYVDTAFHMNISKNSITSPAVYRAYDAPGGFILHAAHIAVGHSFSPEASAFVSLDFGSDAAINSANYAPGGGMPADVREGYAKWTPGDFTLQAGKFVTLNGIEVVDGPLNPTITRGFLYWLAEPVGHTGAKAGYALAEGKAHIGVGLVNGWDRLIDNNNQKTFLFNADFIPSAAFHAQISGSYGAENTLDDKNKRLTVDLTGGVVLDALTINFQGLIGSEPGVGAGGQDDSWMGFGIQPVYTMDAFSLGARLEYFNNKHGSRVAQNQTIPGVGGAPATTALAPVDGTSLLNFTITPGYMLSKSFTLRAEFRIDAVMAAKDGTGATDKNILNGKSSQATWALGATYAF